MEMGVFIQWFLVLMEIMNKMKNYNFYISQEDLKADHSFLYFVQGKIVSFCVILNGKIAPPVLNSKIFEI
jgi:hypothetical protein